LERFRKLKEMDLACSIANLCRFRASVFIQRNEFGLVFRMVPNRIPTVDELGLPVGSGFQSVASAVRVSSAARLLDMS
jgi:Tfp pilus assembly ATPase PilU